MKLNRLWKILLVLQPLQKQYGGSPPKLKTELLCDPAIPLLDRYQKEMK